MKGILNRDAVPVPAVKRRRRATIWPSRLSGLGDHPLWHRLQSVRFCCSSSKPPVASAVQAILSLAVVTLDDPALTVRHP
jgi:hypothetical protein